MVTLPYVETYTLVVYARLVIKNGHQITRSMTEIQPRAQYIETFLGSLAHTIGRAFDII